MRQFLLTIVTAVLCTVARAEGGGFLLGVDVFLQGHPQLLRGHRVGLLTNQTGRNGQGISTADLLHQHPDVNLVALFAPEHGIRGTVGAGEHIGDEVDARTGLPVYSLYGISGHAPTDEMLLEVDTLVYDIQDVGSRAYTYIWSMAECLKACGRNGKTMVVFDRPNPLTLSTIDGPVTEDRWKSFLGLFPIPRVYGMTCGELARYFNSEYSLGCRLVVIPMAGYTRTSTWADTGLPWVASSPNIPSPESAMCFAATGTIGTIGTVYIGIGTDWPFQLIGAAWFDAAASAPELNAMELPGVTFQPYPAFDPPGNRGPLDVVHLQITDPSTFRPTITEMAIIRHLQARYGRDFRWPRKSNDSFDKAMGTSSVREGLQRGEALSTIIESWRGDHELFLQRRARYLIYE